METPAESRREMHTLGRRRRLNVVGTGWSSNPRQGHIPPPLFHLSYTDRALVPPSPCRTSSHLTENMSKCKGQMQDLGCIPRLIFQGAGSSHWLCYPGLQSMILLPAETLQQRPGSHLAAQRGTRAPSATATQS